jgi:two-component system response regulator MprA
MSTAGRIMVIDDDAAIRDLLADGLGDDGYEVRGVGSGREALVLLVTWAPELVILDLSMADLDGEGFLEACRRDGRDGFTVLLLSARPDVGAEAERLGVPDAVSKPFELADLIDTVGRLLAR